jgi:D-glycero-alpha-D-manno-heptose-7-phosphate kinase
VIITRTPLRISLGGGGTDLPSYYRAGSGGFLVAAAVSKYVFIAINRNFERSILLKYSRIERVQGPGDVEHPLFREALQYLGVDSPVEISSMADIPAGTGLGSSGTFTVGLLRALHAYRHETVTSQRLAEEACHLEIDRLGEPIGRQDQYIAALGGVIAMEFGTDDRVEISPVRMSDPVRHRFEDNLLLFYTGMRRSASETLAVERDPHRTEDLRDNLDAVLAVGREAHRALEGGDLETFAKLLTFQWQLKLDRAPTDKHRAIDRLIQDGIDAGASGGKLVGAGGGGFLLFYAEEKTGVRDVMASRGLEEIRFGIDYEGSTTIVAQ